MNDLNVAELVARLTPDDYVKWLRADEMYRASIHMLWEPRSDCQIQDNIKQILYQKYGADAVQLSGLC